MHFLWFHYKLQQWSDEESMNTWEGTDHALNGYFTSNQIHMKI